MGKGRGDDGEQKTQNKVVGITLNTVVSMNMMKLNSFVKR